MRRFFLIPYIIVIVPPVLIITNLVLAYYDLVFGIAPKFRRKG